MKPDQLFRQVFPSLKLTRYEMVRHAFAVASSSFVEETKMVLYNILRRSSYHEALIDMHVKPFRIKPRNKFDLCPYYRRLFNRIKLVITALHEHFAKHVPFGGIYDTSYRNPTKNEGKYSTHIITLTTIKCFHSKSLPDKVRHFVQKDQLKKI